MGDKNHEFCNLGDRHPPHNLEYPTLTGLLTGIGEVKGKPLIPSRLFQYARVQASDQIYMLVDDDPITWVPITLGADHRVVQKTKSVTESSIAGVSSVTGSFDIELTEGCTYYLLAELLSGTCDDCDIELSSTAFAGSPEIIYQIGQTSGGDPRWQPTTNGDWIDANPWGFVGLTASTIYYRITNGAVGAVDVKFTLHANGVL